MSEATKELIWMNQREEPEVSRDWSSTDLDIEELQAHGEVLCHTKGEGEGVRTKLYLRPWKESGFNANFSLLPLISQREIIMR